MIIARRTAPYSVQRFGWLQTRLNLEALREVIRADKLKQKPTAGLFFWQCKNNSDAFICQSSTTQKHVISIPWGGKKITKSSNDRLKTLEVGALTLLCIHGKTLLLTIALPKSIEEDQYWRRSFGCYYKNVLTKAIDSDPELNNQIEKLCDGTLALTAWEAGEGWSKSGMQLLREELESIPISNEFAAIFCHRN